MQSYFGKRSRNYSEIYFDENLTILKNLKHEGWHILKRNFDGKSFLFYIPEHIVASASRWILNCEIDADIYQTDKRDRIKSGIVSVYLYDSKMRAPAIPKNGGHSPSDNISRRSKTNGAKLDATNYTVLKKVYTDSGLIDAFSGMAWDSVFLYCLNSRGDVILPISIGYSPACFITCKEMNGKLFTMSEWRQRESAKNAL